MAPSRINTETLGSTISSKNVSRDTNVGRSQGQGFQGIGGVGKEDCGQRVLGVPLHQHGGQQAILGAEAEAIQHFCVWGG